MVQAAVSARSRFFADGIGAMATAERLNPKLWDKIKKRYHAGSKGGEPGKWNARKAQLAVQEYKRESQRLHGNTGYKTKKPAPGNSLVKWTREDWGYAGAHGDSRYLPASVRAALTPAEKRKDNKAKKGKKGEHVPYTKAVREKMAARDIL